MFKKKKFLVTILIIVLMGLNINFSKQQKSLISLNLDNETEDRNVPDIKYSANNDTIAPLIIFIQPPENYSEIKKKYYDIIVNITDDNPPLAGNVIVRILNTTNILFNASMSLEGVSQWFFSWNNLTSYPNNKIYIFQVWAKDSSFNGNYNWSRGYYVILSIPQKPTPGILNMVFYIFFASLIIAFIMVYLRKRSASLRYKERK